MAPSRQRKQASRKGLAKPASDTCFAARRRIAILQERTHRGSLSARIDRRCWNAARGAEQFPLRCRPFQASQLRPAQCDCRYSSERVPRRKVLDGFCGVRFSVADAASRARRNTRSLAIFVRSARARSSYSGIERGPSDRGCCLKRSSACSLEVMKLSSALNCVTPRRLMWSLRGSMAR